MRVPSPAARIIEVRRRSVTACLHLPVIQGVNLDPECAKIARPKSDSEARSAMTRLKAARDHLPDVLEPETSRMEALWADLRGPLAWVVAAFFGMGAVVFATTTERGDRRLAELPVEVETVVQRGNSETRLAARRDSDLVGDRRIALERAQLEQRIAELERNVTDVTGSITRPPRDVQVAPREPLPAPREGAAATRELPLVTSSIPAPGRQETSAPAGGVTLATRSQFGVDLGPETSLMAARARWQRAVERHGGVVGSFEPVIAVRETPDGRIQLHVIAGPVSDLQEAAALCARLRSAGTTCGPTSYEGQRLVQR